MKIRCIFGADSTSGKEPAPLSVKKVDVQAHPLFICEQPLFATAQRLPSGGFGCDISRLSLTDFNGFADE
jgi:hypothetical protein